MSSWAHRQKQHSVPQSRLAKALDAYRAVTEAQARLNHAQQCLANDETYMRNWDCTFYRRLSSVHDMTDDMLSHLRSYIRSLDSEQVVHFDTLAPVASE